MNTRKLCVATAVFTVCLAAVAVGQSQSAPPDLSGKWTLVEGDIRSGGPLGREGTITQDGAAITFRSPALSRFLVVPADGSKAVRQGASSTYVWQDQGRWVGRALVVSMKASSGTTPANFEDLMVVSLSANDHLTMVIMA